jgi:phosphoglycerate dehydrogenase-like enzyme
MTRVLITCPQMLRHADEYRTRLAAVGIDADTPDVVQQLSEDELVAIIDRYDGAIAGDDQYTARVLEHATRLRIVSKWGVGVDNIDLQAAEARGIRVSNTPGAFGDEVADVIVGYLVLLARQLHRTDARAKAGEWPKIRGFSLAGKSLGVIGLGAIGQGVARRALAMDMRVLGQDVDPTAEQRSALLGTEIVTIPELLRQADVVSLSCPLTPASRHLIDAVALRTMKPGSYLINASRGGLVDEPALIEALASGHLAGAALDVFEVEPLPAASPLRDFENVILGAHNASNTEEASQRVNELALENLLDGLGMPR